jgi:cell division protein FtsL
MLAQPRTLREPQRDKKRVNVRSAKHATQRRVSRAARGRYAGLLRFCGVLAVGLTLLMIYVTLTARLTSLNYAVARAERERAQLQAETARLDDQVASLRSDDRLARVAAQLHMSDPQQFALVKLPPPLRQEDSSHLAFLSGLANLFSAK